MVQKILRTMQDDLKEVKEMRSKEESLKKSEEERLKSKNEETPQDDLQQKSEDTKKEPETLIAETPVFGGSKPFSLSDLNSYDKDGEEDEEVIINDLDKIISEKIQASIQSALDKENIMTAAPENKEEAAIKPEAPAAAEKPAEAIKPIRKITIVEEPKQTEPEPEIKKMPPREAIQPEIKKVIPASVAEKPVMPPKTEIKDMSKEPIKPAVKTVLPEKEKALSPSAPKKPSAPKSAASDQELSNLIKRVSASMSGTTAGAEIPPPEAKPVKDKDLKDLISRISKNLEKEKEILKEEKPVVAASTLPPLPPVVPAATGANPNGSYWEKLHDTLKGPEENSSQQEQIAAIENEIMMKKPAEIPKPVEAIKPTETIKPAEEIKPATVKPTESKEQEETGLIVPKQEAKLAAIQTIKKAAINLDGDYVSPENRLIFGKQEFYSTLHKKIVPKTKKVSLENLKDVVKEDEKRYSDEDEKKMLRKRIVQKYGIKLFSMPWGRIIVFTVLLLTVLGGSLYLILPRVVNRPVMTEELSTGESIALVDQKITNSITARQKEVTNSYYFNDGSIYPWNQLGDKDVYRLVINYDDHDIMLPRDVAMKSVLKDNNFYNMPADVLRLTGSRYDILAFKNNDHFRLGIVMSYDITKETELREAMLAWEKAGTESSKIYNVMKPLFASDGFEKIQDVTFQPATYRGVELKYVNLPDSDTSMDYILTKGFLVFTTSKDTTFEMIDMVSD